MNQTGKQLAAVGLLAVMLSVIGYVAYGDMGENLVYYWTPAELLEKGDEVRKATVRLGGVVQQGTVVWKPETLSLTFRLGMLSKAEQDARVEPGQEKLPNVSVAVQAHGAPPQMFQEGMGAVLEGRYDGSVFHADRVMVKHSNEYRAPKEGERPQDLYKTLLPGGGGAPSAAQATGAQRP